jgi:glycosyltransferase involved in cell wall biosynthesis
LSIQVSIVVSNYHKQDFIQECLDSIYSQTYKSFEVIVIDDSNGEDAIDYIVNQYKPDSFCKTDDIGLSALRMYGVKKSRGKYVLFIDGDDKIHPDFLKRTLETLEANPEFSICYTDTQHFGEANTCWLQPDYNFSQLLIDNYICSCSLIRKNDLLACGGFDLDNFNYWEDYEFWINMGAHGYYGIHIPEKLFYYRIHKNSGTQSERDKILAPVYRAYIINKFNILYPRNFKSQVENVLLDYPKDFMKFKPHEQESWLKAQGKM